MGPWARRLKTAAGCLHEASENLHAARLYRQLRFFKPAATLFEKTGASSQIPPPPHTSSSMSLSVMQQEMKFVGWTLAYLKRALLNMSKPCFYPCSNPFPVVENAGNNPRASAECCQEAGIGLIEKDRGAGLKWLMRACHRFSAANMHAECIAVVDRFPDVATLLSEEVGVFAPGS